MTGESKLPFDAASFLTAGHNGRTASTYQAGRALFSQGDPANSLFYIENGNVKITVLSEQGKGAVIALLAAGDFCGEQCMTGQAVRTTAATAMGQCTVIRVEKAIRSIT